MAHGWVYLVAIVDWASRRVLAHRVSISMDVSFCIEALEEAFARHGQPEIFNSDQGSQFTSEAFTDMLKERGIAISMDGRGAWRDKDYAAYCTSFARSGKATGSAPRRERLTPCDRLGALPSSGSYRDSFLSL